MRPVLGITMGDINGIGPEIVAKAFARPEVLARCRPVVFGLARCYEGLRRNDAPAAVVVSSLEDALGVDGAVPFLEGEAWLGVCKPGRVDPDAGKLAMQWIQRATELALAGDLDAIVTCPINKEGIHRAGFSFQGHTDFIAELTGAVDYRMGLFAGSMRVVHHSAHVSLRDALDLITVDRVVDSIRIGDNALAGLGLGRRRIAVAGLNPHAGEAGAFGVEEIRVVSPAIELCREEGVDCHGPISPDAVFRSMRAGDFDLVVALYHDQGHIPMKLIAMDEGVNVTLGVPITRTSVDHGTAYDIAGKGVAREDSLIAAIDLAVQLAKMGQEAGG